MRKIVCGSILLASLAAPAFGAPAKKRVAVMNFDFGTVHRWWSGDWDIGKGIADMVVTELVKEGTYSVIERKALDAVLAEQNFANSNRADASTASKIGKLLGVNVILVGSITQFGTEDKGFSLGGIGGKLGGFGGGKVGTSKGKANVVIDARLVDVNTGEILAVATGKGESSRSGLLLEGGGAGGGGFGAGGIDMGSKNFQETIIGEATRQSVQGVAKEVVASAGKIPTSKVEIRGLVADVEGKTIILNVGSSSGVQVGDHLKVVRVSRTVKDPATGKVLREITEDVGEIEIAEADAGSSTGTIVSGTGVKVGDVVRNE